MSDDKYLKNFDDDDDKKQWWKRKKEEYERKEREERRDKELPSWWKLSLLVSSQTFLILNGVRIRIGDWVCKIRMKNEEKLGMWFGWK